MHALRTVLAAVAITVAVAGTSDATLINIGRATYNGSFYNLIYDSDYLTGPIVWFNYTNRADTWGNQIAWASTLNGVLSYEITQYAGFYFVWDDVNWRLPNVTSYSNDELKHLLVNELGDLGSMRPFNTGALSNLQNLSYWYDNNVLGNNDLAYRLGFNTSTGYMPVAANEWNQYLGIAVRSGHYQPVPEPSTFLLLSAGIVGVALIRRKIKG